MAVKVSIFRKLVFGIETESTKETMLSTTRTVFIKAIYNHISVGNPRGHLIRNAKFVYEKPSIQGTILKYLSLYLTDFIQNKVQRTTQIELFLWYYQESWI